MWVSGVSACACVCVCVEHLNQLNRCKTSTSFLDSRGHAAIMQTHANEAMHDGGSRVLINSVYLLFQLRLYFCCNGTGLSR